MKIYASQGEFELDPELVRSLVSTYPAVNVRRELEKMHLWTLKNSARRWSNPLRGIEAWLKKASKSALEARSKKQDTRKQREAAYLDGAKTRVHVVTDAWWTTDEATMRKARELGMPARPGESMAEWRRRLADADKIRSQTRAA